MASVDGGARLNGVCRGGSGTFWYREGSVLGIALWRFGLDGVGFPMLLSSSSVEGRLESSSVVC